MSDPVSDLKRQLLAAAARQQEQTIPAPKRRRGGGRRRVVALVAAVLVVAVGTASAIGGVRDFFLDRGFIGLPPQGATPSAPESGELVLQWEGRSATLDGAPVVRAWVYADGRIIWSQTASRSGPIPEGANELTSGYLEQSLTPDGVELLQSEVVGLLDRSRALLETVSPDDDPLPGPFGGLALFVPGDDGFSGVRWGSLQARDGDRLVRLQWRGIPAEGSERFQEILDDMRKRFEGTIATPEQVSDLRRIDALLTDPASVLPTSAWAVPKIRAYVPSHYAVCIDTAPPKDASHVLSLLPPRAADVLRDKSRTSSEDDVVTNIDQEPGHMVVIGRSITYCSKLTTEEAREVAEALSGLDPDPGFQGKVRLAYLLAEPVDNLNPTSIWFEPYFPHGQVTCSACG
ncbi:MAG TPA: hypothetical protein VLA69_03040 [Gaiellaceae bacterium]|nr:hypothetical protein [Gaiellaceae bacterium]